MGCQLDTLSWQPSRDVLKAAAFLTAYLFFWTLAMLWSFWIRIDFKNCECTKETCVDRGGGAKTIDPFTYWLFIETLCEDYPGPLTSLRKDCLDYEERRVRFFPPGKEYLDWQLIQSSVFASNALTCCGFVLIVFALAAPSTAYLATPQPDGGRRNGRGRVQVRRKGLYMWLCAGYSKRRAQQLVIAINVVICVLCFGSGVRVFTSSSYDVEAWGDAIEKHFNATCDITAIAGPAVPCGVLAVWVSAVVVAMLAFPGAHCLGYHEPGRICAHCVDQSVDADGTSLA